MGLLTAPLATTVMCLKSFCTSRGRIQAGGSYTVMAHISDPKMRKGGEASCSASFRVKEPPKNPPALSCSANPTTVQTGTSSTISCTCTSPDNVPVTVGD